MKKKKAMLVNILVPVSSYSVTTAISSKGVLIEVFISFSCSLISLGQVIE
jgi:hypothetical protein